MKPNPDFFTKLLKFIQNEVMPREQKYQCQTWPELIGIIFVSEYDKKTSRRDSRKMLDRIFQGKE